MFYLLGAMIDPPTWIAALAAMWLLKRGPMLGQYAVSVGIYIAAILLILAFASNPPVNMAVSAAYGIASTLIWLSIFKVISWARSRRLKPE